MKIITLLCGLMMAVMLIPSCKQETPSDTAVNSAPVSPSTLCIVRDLSASAGDTGVVSKEEESFLRKYLNKEIKAGQPANVYVTFVIDGQGLDNLKLFSMNATPTPDATSDNGDSKMLMEKMQAEENASSAKKKLVKNSVDFIFSKPCNQPRSSILEFLPMLEKMRKASTDSVSVLLMTDLIENSRKYRNLIKTPPQSAAEAENFAKMDYPRLIKDHKLKPDFLKNTKIRVYLPAGRHQSINIFIESYWRKVFSLAGCSDFSILY